MGKPLFTPFTNPDGDEIDRIWTVSDSGLRQRLYLLTGNSGILGAKQRHQEYTLLQFREAITDWARENDRLADLPEFIASAAQDEGEVLESALAEQKLPFHLLRRYLRHGTEIVVTGSDGSLQGGVLRNVETRVSWSGPYLRVIYDAMHWTNAGPRGHAQTLLVPYYSGQRELTKLPFRPVTTEEKALLQRRATRYAALNGKRELVRHEGVFSYDFSWFGQKALGLRGRFIVDPVGFCRADTDTAERLGISQRREDGFGMSDDDEPESVVGLEWTFPPHLYGFSFQRKAWGRVHIDDVADLRWRDDALDLLVLDPVIKKTVMAMCRAGGHVFQDVVDFKGDGINFILSGPPGVGKTLTAEAVAEALHRPLYIVGSGELGDEPEKVEERLREIVNLAESWGAVVLLDEAEVFMVKRTMGDVTRNAMVSIFLRALEQHNSVLFLTTNRMDDIDLAFHSRIALSVRYPELSQDDRHQVWRNLLGAAGLCPEWADELSPHPLNGREIKHRIRIAQALAVEAKHDTHLRDILTAIKITEQGRDGT